MELQDNAIIYNTYYQELKKLYLYNTMNNTDNYKDLNIEEIYNTKKKIKRR